MKRAAIGALLLCSTPLAYASDALTGARFLEMNEGYRTGVVHGLMSAVITLGVPDELKQNVEIGLECRLKRPTRRATFEEVSIEFARHLAAHPEDEKGDLTIAFVLFLAECSK